MKLDVRSVVREGSVDAMQREGDTRQPPRAWEFGNPRIGFVGWDRGDILSMVGEKMCGCYVSFSEGAPFS
jgi:hypothetical protein